MKLQIEKGKKHAQCTPANSTNIEFIEIGKINTEPERILCVYKLHTVASTDHVEMNEEKMVSHFDTIWLGVCCFSRIVVSSSSSFACCFSWLYTHWKPNSPLFVIWINMILMVRPAFFLILHHTLPSSSSSSSLKTANANVRVFY